MSHRDVFLFLIAVVVRFESLGKPLQRHSRNHYIIKLKIEWEVAFIFQILLQTLDLGLM